MGADERRGPRLDLRLRVKFSDLDLPEAEATDISPGGARLESREPLEVGDKVRMELDAGDGEAVETTATVAWCRTRKTVSLRKLYDVGVRFESEWLADRRGKLGRALGRIFSFSEFEPARAFERFVVTLRAERVDLQDVNLTVVDMSEGGMQLRSEGALGPKVFVGAAVIIEIPIDEDGVNLDGEVVWVAEQDQGEAALFASFGVRFTEPGERERLALRGIKEGEHTPGVISVFLPG